LSGILLKAHAVYKHMPPCVDSDILHLLSYALHRHNEDKLCPIR
jgi:hypothetical protein